VRSAGLALELGRAFGVTWRAVATVEQQDSLAVHAVPARGAYDGTIAALPIRAGRLSLRLERPTALALFGTELRTSLELRATVYRHEDTSPIDPMPRDEIIPRAAVVAHVERPVGGTRLVAHSVAAALAVSPDVKRGMPPQELVYFGGPTTAPGYDLHELVGSAGLSQRLEWQLPLPFVAVPLGRFGRAPARATLAPFAQVALVDGQHDPVRRLGGRVSSLVRGPGGYPSVGVGLLTLFELLRIDVARGLRDGHWSLSVDLSRDFWRIL
jgi:hypothetical protein